MGSQTLPERITDLQSFPLPRPSGNFDVS
jgi:hypothetical protein